MKSISMPLAIDDMTEDAIFETALSIPGVLAILVDARTGEVHVLTSSAVSAELAKSALRPFANA